MSQPLRRRDLDASPLATHEPAIAREKIAPSDVILDNPIYRGRHTDIYRAHGPQNKTLIVKRLSPNDQARTSFNQLKHEYELLKLLDCHGVRRAIAFAEIDSVSSLIMEDVQGVSLPEALKSRRFVLSRILQIFSQWARALAELHVRGIIHRNINPTNVLVEPSTDALFLIDFGNAVRLNHAQITLPTTSDLGVDPNYAAPELSGRTPHPIDERSDLYSLGASFYEILVGKPPQSGTSEYEAKAAKIPGSVIAPHEIDPQIPAIVSRLVMKLLENNPDSRYQSALGLAQDLERMIRLLQSKELATLARMPLGQNDKPLRLCIPKRLYGRETEFKSLLQHWQLARSKTSSFVLIHGDSGAGKSTLTEAFLKQEIESRATLAKVKLHAASRTTPLDGILLAARTLAQNTAQAAESAREHLKLQLASSLGANVGLLTDLLPELKSILGEQEKPLPLPPDPSKNRLITTFVKFFHCFSTAERPLVLFFDDLQWADTTSLEIVTHLASGSKSHPLLILATCRSDLDTPNTSLTRALAAWPTYVPHYRHLELGELNETSVIQLCADTFGWTPEQAQPLATHVRLQTAGNPLLIHHFIRKLYSDNLIKFNLANASWQIDAANLESLVNIEMKQERFRKRLQQLPRSLQMTLAYAAFTGNDFSCDSLTSISSATPVTLAADLERAHSEGLIDIVGSESNRPKNTYYRFAHEQILEACLGLVDPQTARSLRLKVARQILEPLPPSDLSTTPLANHLFHALDYLNDSFDLIVETEERARLTRIYRDAAARAEAATAWDIAAKLYRQGRRLCTDNNSCLDSDLLRSLQFGEGICALLAGDDTGVAVFETLLAQATTPYEIASLHHQRCQIFMARGDRTGAIDSGLSGLAALGVHLASRDPSFLRTLYMMFNCQHRVLGRSAEEILDLPIMRQERDLLIMRLLTDTISAAALVQPKLATVLVCLQINHVLTAGHSVYSAMPFLYLALAVNAVAAWLTVALRTKESVHSLLSLYRKIDNKHSDSMQHLRCEFFHQVFTAHWSSQLRNKSMLSSSSFERFLDQGDNTLAAYCKLASLDQSFSFGDYRNDTKAQNDAWNEFISRHHDQQTQRNIELFNESLSALGGTDLYCASQVIASFDRYSLESIEAQAVSPDMLQHQGQIMTILGNHAKSFAYLTAALRRGQIFKTAGNYKIPLLVLMLNINIAHLYDDAPLLVRIMMRMILAWSSRLMRVYSSISPEYGICKKIALEGLHAIIIDQKLDLGHEKLEHALHLAKQHGLTSDEAILAEYLANVALDRNLISLALGPLAIARSAYKRWGLNLKVHQIDTLLRDTVLVEHRQSVAPSPLHSNAHAPLESNSMGEPHNENQLIQVAFTLSQQLDSNEFKRSLMQLLADATGARIAALVWYEGSTASPSILAYRTYDGQISFAKQTISEDLLVLAALNEVEQNRTRLVVGDARHMSPWSENSTVQSRGVKSLACIPIFQSLALRGMLYLENDLVAHAFTPERLSILTVIANQTAISLDNAQRYSQLSDLLAREQSLRAELQSTNLASTKLEQNQGQHQSGVAATEIVQKSLFAIATPDSRYEISSVYQPNETVGGDWYSSFHDAKHDRLFLGIGHVTGEGIPSALVCAAVTGTANSVIAGFKDDEEINLSSSVIALADALNSAVKGIGDPTGRLMTMTLIGIDLQTGRGAYINAAHQPAIWYAQHQKTLLAAGVPLGFREGSAAKLFGRLDFQLVSGDALLLHSLGLLENHQADGSRISSKHLRKLGESDRSPTRIISELKPLIQNFRRDENFDDTTCIVFRWLGPL